jgi:serpin B
MTRLGTICLSLLLLAPVVVAGDESGPNSSLASASNAFGFDLYRELRGGEGNLAFSPASIEIALAMTWAGARGDTAKEMSRVLRLEGSAKDVHASAEALLSEWRTPEPDTYALVVVNRLFGDERYRFEEPYLDLIRASYGAEIEALDFRTKHEQARIRINEWAEQRTAGRSRDLLPAGSLSRETRLVLTNAVYFLGRWSKPFDAEATKEEPFHTGGGETVPAQLMHQAGSFLYAEDDGVQFLELAYEGGHLAMDLLLPESRDGLADLEKNLRAGRVDGGLARLEAARVKVAVPRFRVEPAEALRLAPLLRELGMPLAFTQNADFTGIANPEEKDEGIYLADVFHKAFVDVDEVGTEAAATTGAVMVGRSFQPEPGKEYEFRADHPFVFLIRDLRSGTILFLGRVVDPTG